VLVAELALPTDDCESDCQPVGEEDGITVAVVVATGEADAELPRSDLLRLEEVFRRDAVVELTRDEDVR